MYNLIVGYAEDFMSGSRLLEYTDQAEREYLLPGAGPVDLGRLMRLPTLLMPETGHDLPQFARIGQVRDARWEGGDLRFRFVPNPHLAPLPSHRIVGAAVVLGIDSWEFTRTHWAVKPYDLYGVLGELQTAVTSPTVFNLPVDTPREPDLVAVMMPFDAGMAPAYAALQAGAAQAGFRCQRADDIWVNQHIMDDVISLIWRAQVVISDFTGKNANVFYETGIAHTLGRDVIQVTQSLDEVPFDLRSIRTLLYLNNNEGRLTLTNDLANRLATLAPRP